MNYFGNTNFSVGVRRLFYAVTPNETSFEKLEDVPDYLNEAIPFFNGAILLEFLICWLKGVETLRLNDGLSSVTAGIFLQLSKFLIISFELVTYSWIHTNYRLVVLPWNSPWTWFIAFLTIDFLYYWFHRAAHEINFIWAAHQVHHSAEDYNLSTALRQSVVQRYFSMIVYFPSALFVPPSAYFVHVQFNLLYQFWIHTELVKSLGPLEYILNAPSHHRVHHGRNPYCIDKNYGGTLIIFDRLFGTFQDETDEKVVYGLTHPVNTWNPIWIQICHFVHIGKTFWSIEGFKNKIYVLVKGPGWSPGKPRLGDPADIPQLEYPISKYDNGLPLWGNIYIVIHTILLSICFQELFLKQLTLTQTNVLGVVLFLFASGTCFGFLMDNKWYSPHLELIRCVVFLLVDYQLSLRQKRIEVVPLPLLDVTRIIFAISAIIWFLLCFRSGKILEKEE